MSGFKIDVLVVAAHPDDAELSVGGTLAKLSHLGYSTGVLDLTRGELSSAGDLKTRGEETMQASQLLGLSLRENLELPDGWLNPYSASDATSASKDSQIVKVVAALRRIRPELLLVPYWEDRHPDHSAASHLLSRAIFLAGVTKFPGGHVEEKFTPRQTAYYPLRHQFKPSFIVDTSGFFDKKTAAVNAFQSQLMRTPHLSTLLNSPLTMSSIDARDSFYGAMIGTSHGEPFLILNSVGLADPIEHFRLNPYSEALIFPGSR